jgi:hypothetical protein
MIRKSVRILFRMGLLAGLGMALFKFVQGRRSSEYGRPSTDWAPAPAVNLNLPRTPPDPPLVQPVVLEEIIEKKKAVVDAPAPAPEPVVAEAAGESVIKKAPAKKAAAKKKVAEPPAAGPVKKAAPKKAAAKKAPAAEKAPVAKKAAPAKKAAKKLPPE